LLNNKVIIGRITSPYGLQGWLKLQSFTDPPHNICAYPQGWYKKPGKGPKEEKEGDWQPYQAIIKQGSKTLLIQFPDCNTPESARKLTGSLLAIDRDVLPKLKKEEYYWSDLENLQVITVEGIFLGKVDQIINTGANDIIIVKNNIKKIHLIPYINNTVIQVNLEKQEIIVDWDPEF
jgi:16S rRNA processing protein RimM